MPSVLVIWQQKMIFLKIIIMIFSFSSRRGQWPAPSNQRKKSNKNHNFLPHLMFITKDAQFLFFSRVRLWRRSLRARQVASGQGSLDYHRNLELTHVTKTHMSHLKLRVCLDIWDLWDLKISKWPYFFETLHFEWGPGFYEKYEFSGRNFSILRFKNHFRTFGTFATLQLWKSSYFLRTFGILKN